MSPTPAQPRFGRPEVFVLEADYEPLSDLVCASERETAGIRLLWQELERAVILAQDEAPADLVTMGCSLRFTDLARGQRRRVRLVFPAQAAAPDLVSVTSSLGAGLIGLRAGDEFAWVGPDGDAGRIRVDAVEPTGAGDSWRRAA